MNSSESSIICPICFNTQVLLKLKVKDHSVSREYFDLLECSRCSLRFTKNPPEQNEIGRYYQSEDYISHSNTRRGIVNMLYHGVRNHTLAVKHHLVEKTTGLKLGHHLDIGAGTGSFVQYMNSRGWNSQGIEPDDAARQKAVEHHHTKLLPAEALFDFIPESFDAITLWHVLEHVHDLHPFLHQVRRILKPRGMIYIAVPNYTSYDAKKYGADWAAYDVPRHLYHFSPDSMKWLLNATGFHIQKLEPMWYDSFYISLLSEKYAKGKMPLLSGFFTGAVSNLKTMGNKENCSSLIYIAEKA